MGKEISQTGFAESVGLKRGRELFPAAQGLFAFFEGVNGNTVDSFC